MKTIAIITSLTMLLAVGAMAASPDDFSSDKKIAPVKDTIMFEKGLLDCSGAIPIALDNVYTGDNTGIPSMVDAYSCSSWAETGGEVIYSLFLAEPAMFEASIAGSGCDLDLAVLDQCDEDLGCLIVVDSGVSTNTPVSGQFFFVVDGYNGAGCPFTFEINSVEPPEPVDFCALVEDVTGSYFTGTTCGGQNLISSMDCGTYTEDGLEVYYEIFMPAGSSFTADVLNTADGALWVVDSCVEPMNCLAYADDTLGGEVESVSYTNAGADTYVYLVLDSWGTDSCGDYEFTFTATGGAVSSDQVTLESLKALYR